MTPGEIVGDGRLWRGEAPAKVNLRLRVLAREESGFHQIETVFQSLALADRVEIELVEGGGVTVEVQGPFAAGIGPAEENLALRAALRFGEALRAEGQSLSGVRIRLQKEIPHGAGLGGGSSDAAALLRGLNALFGAPLSPDTLLRVGGALGSDVPFFLSGFVRALGRGRGELLLPLPPLPPRPLLLALPTPGISTGWAYGVLADTRAARPRGAPSTPLVASRVGDEGWPEVAREAVNDFEEVLFPLRPDLARVREALLDSGARPALLSGSGSALFGVFEEGFGMEGGAQAVEAALPGILLLRTHTRG